MTVLTRLAFLETWNEAESIEDVARATGYSAAACSRRAHRMKQAGYELRAFKRGPPRKYGPGIKHKNLTRGYEPMNAKESKKQIRYSRLRESWNQCYSVADACALLGYKRDEALEIIAHWRAKGVELKKMEDE